MNPDYRTLDAIVVIGCLLIVALMIAGFFLASVPDSITPVLSSLATAILAIPGMYGAYRWGNAVGSKRPAPGAQEDTKS